MGKIAFVFSGQGAQYSGMGKELYDSSPAAKKVFDVADKIRSNTSEQCFYGTKEELMQTINTQPDVFCVDLAAAFALSEKGVKPDMAAGFSLGEIPALTFCGAFDLEDAFRFICKRAEFMDECAGKKRGEMAAVLGLTALEVENLCKNIKNIYPVNYNCDTQTVVAGHAAGILELAEQAKALGGKVKKLEVSGAFHSPCMDEASEMIDKYLKNISFTFPSIPVYANFTAKIYNEKSLLSKQINHAVLWNQTVKHMIEDGADIFVEMGPGRVLTGLIKKISKDVRTYNVFDEATLKSTAEELIC